MIVIGSSTPLVQLLPGIIFPNDPSKLSNMSQTQVRCFQDTHNVCLALKKQLAWRKRHVPLTFFMDLWVGTAVNAADSSPTFMFMSLFFVPVIAEYFSATFSLSLNSLLACFTSSFASPPHSVMAICIYTLCEPLPVVLRASPSAVTVTFRFVLTLLERFKSSDYLKSGRGDCAKNVCRRGTSCG